MEITDWIPITKMDQFHRILCQTGGRYLSNPLVIVSKVRVHFEPGDYSSQQEAWQRCTTPIRETRNDQCWKRFFRRCKKLLET